MDEIGQDDQDNPYINWISTENPDDLHLAQIIADLSDKADQGFEDDDDDEQDSINWQKLVHKHLWDYGDVFSRRKQNECRYVNRTIMRSSLRKVPHFPNRQNYTRYLH